jgi:hypothetical protein
MGNQNPYIEEEQTTQWPIRLLITSLVSDFLGNFFQQELLTLPEFTPGF